MEIVVCCQVILAGKSVELLECLGRLSDVVQCSSGKQTRTVYEIFRERVRSSCTGYNDHSSARDADYDRFCSKKESQLCRCSNEGSMGSGSASAKEGWPSRSTVTGGLQLLQLSDSLLQQNFDCVFGSKTLPSEYYKPQHSNNRFVKSVIYN